MAILRSKYLIDGLNTIRPQGEQLVFEHAQMVAPILEEAKVARESGQEGWTNDRAMQRIASIPAGVFVQHPEFVHDPRLVVKWLRTEEGKPYRTTRGRI